MLRTANAAVWRQDSLKRRSDEGLEHGGDLGAAGVALGRSGRGCFAGRDDGLCDARLAEAMAAGHVDVQVGQGLPVHADAAGEGLGIVGIARGSGAVPGCLLVQLCNDEVHLFVHVEVCNAANVLNGVYLLLQIHDLIAASYPLPTLCRTHRDIEFVLLVGLVGLGALGVRLGHLCSVWLHVPKQKKTGDPPAFYFLF